MYWEYFGFEENPFSISPDPRYLYMSKRHQEALAHLVYGIGESGGFVLLSGEVGTGKTTICRSLIEQLPENVDLAFVLNPRLNDVELLATICDEMAVAYPRSEPTLKVLVDRLNEHLLRAHAIGRQPVLLIDEAQNLDPAVLEQIRLLTNLETNKRKLLQIVLIGQPELNDLLSQPDLRQLDQRITARYHLRPLTVQETGGYIRHRLQVGGAPTDIFSEAAIRRIFRATGGIPRLINTLCDRCLLGAYAENKRKVDAKLVRSAAKEVITRRPANPQRYAAPGFFAATAAAAAFILIDPLNLDLPGSMGTPADPGVNMVQPSPEIAPTAAPAAPSNPPEGRATPAAQPIDIRNMAAALPAADIDDDPATAALQSLPATAPESDSEQVIEDAPEPREVVVAAVDADSLLPPPPPLPAGTTATRTAANVERGPWKPIIPPSSSPHEMAAFHGPIASLLDEPISGPRRELTAHIGTQTSEITSDRGLGQTDTLDVGPVLSTESASRIPAVSRDTGLRGGSLGLTSNTDQSAPAETSEPVRLTERTAPDTESVSRTTETPSAQTRFESLDPESLNGDLESALRNLFGIWGYQYVDMKGLSPCKKARYANLRCMQGQATWHELAIANRPTVITLAADGADSVYVVLSQIDGDNAEIVLGDGTTVRTKIGALTHGWAGDYLLLWRPPLQFTRELKPGVRGDDVLWLRNNLLSLGWDTRGIADELFYDDGLQAAVRDFQRRRGLTVDGVAGPQTILQVNAALGTSTAPTIQ